MNPDSPRHVIYIEDDQEMIELVVMILNRRGFRVTGIRGGEKGLDAVANELPDLVLLDLMMPGVDGWEVFQKIKAGETTRDIPVIIITAKAEEIDRVLGINIARVDDYITKPFRPYELVDHIEQILSNRQR